MRRLIRLLIVLLVLTGCGRPHQPMTCAEIANLLAQVGKTVKANL